MDPKDPNNIAWFVGYNMRLCHVNLQASVLQSTTFLALVGVSLIPRWEHMTFPGRLDSVSLDQYKRSTESRLGTLGGVFECL